MDVAISDDVTVISVSILFDALAGFAVVLILIFMISRFLTTPLAWMEKVADQVVNNAGAGLGDGLDPNSSPELACSPNVNTKTEVSELVEEFKIMITGFGGSGAAKLHKHEVHEVPNPCSFSHEQKMRLGYAQDNFPPSAPAVGKVDGGDGGVVTVSAFAVPSAVVQGDIEMAIIDQASTTNANNGFLNKGRNAMVATVETTTGRARKSKAKRETSIFVSPLFRYIVLLIVAPLIATLVHISTATTLRLHSDIPLWLHDVEEAR